MSDASDKRFSSADAAVLKDILRHRRDVRGNRFLPDAVTDQEISQLIDAALFSPSVGFSQPWEFMVIRDHAVKRDVQGIFMAENEKAADQFTSLEREQYVRLKLEGITEAPVNMAVFYNPERGPVLGQTSMEEMGLYSVVCAVQNIWLMARAMNIGVGWVSILDPEKVCQCLNVPADRRLVAYLCIGKVSEFPATPELETLAWRDRKLKQQLVYRDNYPQPWDEEPAQSD